MRFTTEEIESIRAARKINPSVSQRGLASQLYLNPFYTALYNRTEAAIYGAIRRYDRTARETNLTDKGSLRLASV